MAVRYKEVKTIREFIGAIRLRVDVFIKEQGFQPGWEPDDDDKISKHFIANVGGKVVATARVRDVGNGKIKIERMAVRKEYRNKHIGKGLLEYMLKKIGKLKPKRIWLRSQMQAQPFYEKCGFRAVTKPFKIWGVPHMDMEYRAAF